MEEKRDILRKKKLRQRRESRISCTPERTCLLGLDASMMQLHVPSCHIFPFLSPAFSSILGPWRSPVGLCEVREKRIDPTFPFTVPYFTFLLKFFFLYSSSMI